MAEFELTKSGLTDASKSIRSLNAEFQEQAQETFKAAETLGQSWDGDASEKFLSNAESLLKWAEQMVEIVNSYSDALDKGNTTYADADATAAKNFKK